jgi:hypothetical protein
MKVSASEGEGVPAPESIQDLAKKVAAELGDPAPASAEYVLTTRSAANQLFGAGVDTDQPVYLVVMGGEFTMQDARVPFGLPGPSGSFAVLVIDVSTGQVVDRGITSSPVSASLDTLGTVGPVFPP